MLASAEGHDAASFFLCDLAQLVGEWPAAFSRLSGVLAVDVHGQGKWTVRLGDLEAPVVPGFDPHADLKLWLLGDGFARFLDGTLDARDARRVVVDGDVGVLTRFRRLLCMGR